MNQWRITKYDPGLRDNSGAYQGDAWIMMSDIGSEFNGKHFTAEEYVKTEDKYVTVASALLKAFGVPYLNVKQLHTPAVGTMTKDVASRHGLYEEANLLEGQRLNLQEALHAIRLMLREFVWCKLEFENRFFIHVGWDYYMYVGTTLDGSEFAKILRDSGLFAEPFESPYHR